MNMAFCPVCNSRGQLIRYLESKFILNQLELYYNKKVPNDLGIIDYEMRRCQKCSLEWANPLQGGSSSFYQWITGHSGYYPNKRWEWFIAIEQIKKKSSISRDSLLEVGCGSGRFLELIAQQIPDLSIIGLDTTITSVDLCRNKGLNVFSETIESFSCNSGNMRKEFDFIVAFHCLEHVSNPKDFVSSMLSILKPGGKIFLSTPYSPMSFEAIWFDPLNHPPHHLTRWNILSYNELARQLELKCNHFMPSADGVVGRALFALNLARNGPANLDSRNRMMGTALHHPLTTLRELMRQNRYQTVNNKTAANVVMVEFSRK